MQNFKEESYHRYDSRTETISVYRVHHFHHETIKQGICENLDDIDKAELSKFFKMKKPDFEMDNDTLEEGEYLSPYLNEPEDGEILPSMSKRFKYDQRVPTQEPCTPETPSNKVLRFVKEHVLEDGEIPSTPENMLQMTPFDCFLPRTYSTQKSSENQVSITQSHSPAKCNDSSSSLADDSLNKSEVSMDMFCEFSIIPTETATNTQPINNTIAAESQAPEMPLMKQLTPEYHSYIPLRTKDFIYVKIFSNNCKVFGVSTHKFSLCGTVMPGNEIRKEPQKKGRWYTLDDGTGRVEVCYYHVNHEYKKIQDDSRFCLDSCSVLKKTPDDDLFGQLFKHVDQMLTKQTTHFKLGTKVSVIGKLKKKADKSGFLIMAEKMYAIDEGEELNFYQNYLNWCKNSYNI